MSFDFIIQFSFYYHLSLFDKKQKLRELEEISVFLASYLRCFMNMGPGPRKGLTNCATLPEKMREII